MAKGVVSFRGLYFRIRDLRIFAKGEPLYEGRVEYSARRVDGYRRLEEFRLPNYKVKVVRKADGNWKKETLAAAAPQPAADVDDATRQDLKALEGTWVAVSYEKAGGPVVATADDKPAPADVQKMELVIKADTLTSTTNAEVGSSGTFKLDATARPKTIDLRFGHGEQDKDSKETTTLTLLGIYELNGDELKMCFQERSGRRTSPSREESAIVK